MKTIIDLQKTVGYPTEGIFKQSISGTTIETMFQEYADKIDSVLFTQYGNRVLYDNLEYANDLDVEKLELIKVYILSEMLATEYKWEHLIATTKAEYNPTENYNMVETEETKDKKNENTETNQTNTNGERNTESTNTNAVSPYDTNELSTESQQTGTTRENSVIDTSTNNGTYTTDNTESRTLTRKGNLGVTTTQEMLASERTLADYSIVKLISKDVANLISKGVYYDL